VNLVGLEGYEGSSLREYRKNNGSDGVTPHIYGKDKHALKNGACYHCE
jgi:hypothetical protein